MKPKIIAYCGLNCEECEAYKATINNDDELREKVAKEWSILNKIEITKEMINCEGCHNNGKKTPFCENLCPIRKCAINKNVSTCGECQNLRSCEELKKIIDNNEKELYNLLHIKR